MLRDDRHHVVEVAARVVHRAVAREAKAQRCTAQGVSSVKSRTWWYIFTTKNGFLDGRCLAASFNFIRLKGQCHETLYFFKGLNISVRALRAPDFFFCLDVKQF